MMGPSTTIAALLLAGLLAGCADRPRAQTSERAASEASGAADKDGALSAPMRLALAKVPGQSKADRAVTAAQEAARKNPTKADLWITLGRAWVQKAREASDPGFYLNADAAAEVVLSKDPRHALALDLRGLVLLNGHEFDKARALAAKVVDVHPEDPLAWGNLSDALLELGRYDAAAEAAQKMVDLKPNLPSYSRASFIQWLHGDIAAAKETVRAALDAGRDIHRDPEPAAWVFCQAGMLFWHEGDHEGADAGFDNALERVPGYAPAYVGKGRVAMGRGDYRRAAELFERAYRESPMPETAWLLGDARRRASDAAGAAAAFESLEKEGRVTDPRTLSLFWSTRGEHTREALELARAEYAKRQDVYTEDALAWALYRAGDLASARASITRARRLGTRDARLVYHEGAIAIAAGDVARGRKLVREALTRNPSFDATASVEAHALLGEKVAAR